MERYHIFKDHLLIASTNSREEALSLIRQYQKYETHPLLRSEYSIIKGVEELIEYEK